MNTYHYLFSPVKVGHTTIRNHVSMPPIFTNLADKGCIVDELIQHYEARAEGGVGLIITEVTTVESTYIYLPGDMSTHDDSFIPGWKKLINAVHQCGVKILSQLFHPAYMASPIPSIPRLITPSNAGPPYVKEVPHPATIEELRVITRQFGEVILCIKQAGGDDVEVHAAHTHGLLGGLLTPLYNKRCGEYGGNINGRSKLTLEVVEEIRNVCGPDFVIDVRISEGEYSDSGLNLDDMIYVSEQLETHGTNMLHVSGGTTIKRNSAIPATGTKPGVHAHLSQEIKKHVNIPVATMGRTTEPQVANELTANGRADICVVDRANLCDPDSADKAKCGKDDDIRPCIGCLRYLNGIMFSKRIVCMINPPFELEDEGMLKPAEVKKEILVIGRGPADMEAVFVAKGKGYHVILCEQSDVLGGLMRLAAVPIAKQDPSRTIKYMARRPMQAGAKVRLNCRVEKAMLQGEFADYEVIAPNGAVPSTIKASTGFRQQATADNILTGDTFPGKNIVILEDGSVGCETADYLVPLVYDRYPRDRVIAVLEMTKDITVAESGPDHSLSVQRMLKKHVNPICKATVKKVEKDKIYYIKNGRTECIDDTDILTSTVNYHSDPTLKLLLEECGMIYHMIGDANHTGTIKDAIHDGYETTCST